MSRQPRTCFISGQALRAIRTHHGTTVQGLAEALGVHRMTITRWEKGATQPSPLQILQLSQVLQQDVECFFDDQDGAQMCIVDHELALVPLDKLQAYTQIALRSFSMEELQRRANQLAYDRLIRLLEGARPAALEIQYLRDCLGSAFSPMPPRSIVGSETPSRGTGPGRGPKNTVRRSQQA